MLISRIALRNPEFTIMVFLVLLFMGIFAYISMPRYESPQLDIPGMNLIITYPGASPEDIERIVIDPLEEAISEIDKINKLTSDIRDGFATLRVEFYLTEDKINKNNEVIQKLTRVQSTLPEGVSIRTIEFSVSNIQILQVGLLSETAGYERMRLEAEKLEEKLELLKGIKGVDIEADLAKKLTIDLDFAKLAKYQISPGQVAQLIKNNNLNLPAGSVRIGNKTFNLQTSGNYQSLEAIENTILKSTNQQPLYIKDIAKVYFKYPHPEYLARAKGKRAVFVSVFPQENVNALNTIAQAKEIISEFQMELPADMELEILFDQSISINAKVNLLFENLWQGILVVGFFILLFFNLRASLLVMTAIPLSFLISLICADYAGFGLQFMSIAGLIIALGLLVDNAIVVVENVYHFIKEGHSRNKAAQMAIEQVGWPIVSSTATTVLAFVPLLNIRSLPGEYVRSMPLTLIFTLLASLFVALTFTPFLSSRLLKDTGKQRDSKVQQAIQFFIENYYRHLLDFCLKIRWLVLLVALTILGGALMLGSTLGVSFFPRDDAPIFAVSISAPQGTVLEETDKAVKFAEKVLDAFKEIDYYVSNVGYGNPPMINVIRRNEKQTSSGQIMVFLKEVNFERRDEIILKIREKFKSYTEADIELKEILLGPPVAAQISVELYGDDIQVLKQIAGDVEAMILSTPQTVNVYNPLRNFKNSLKLNINHLAAANQGVQISDIDQNVRIAVAGTKVSEYRDAQQELYDVYVQMERSEDFLRPSDLERIYVNSLSGRLVPLSQVAQLEFSNSPEKINHDLKRRTFAVNADVEAGVNVDKKTQEILEKLEQYKFPKGYTYSMGGELKSRNESFGDLFRSLMVALLGIFTVLVLQFRSYLQPLIIFVAIPLSLIGAVLGLFLAGYSFSFTAFLGIISLVGIVVNDSIILIDLTNIYMKEGMGKEKAIRRAAEHRFVPILLTSLTTIGGLLPLTLRGGLFWAPMGWCIIGGLTTSTLLILVVVPVLYSLFTRDTQGPKKIAI